MQQNGYTQDYATFEKKFVGNDNYANRKKVYDLFSQNGADVGSSYNEFMARLQAKPTAAPRKPMTVMEMQRRVAQEAAQKAKAKAKPKQAQGTPDYMKQWNLLTKPTSQMTPMERSQAEAARTRMQNATRRSFKQKMKQAASSPIMRSRADTQNPMRNANPQPYANLGLDMDETMVELSSPEAQRARAIQQHKDDAMAMAGGNVNDNSGVSSQIDSVVDASMKEASAAAKEQYAKNLDEMGTFASQYERDQAFKGAQDLEQKLRQETITKNLSLKLQEIYSDKKLQSQIVQSADKMNMGIEEYVDKFVTPQIMNRAQQVLGIKNLEEIMPGGTMGYIAKNLLSNSILGTLVAPSVMSRSTRQRMQEGLAISEGLQEMPQVKGHKDNTYRAGAGARFLSTAINMAMDSAPLSVIGGGANLGVDLGKRILTTGLARVGLIKGGAKLTAQQLGFKVANMTMAQKIGSGLLEGSARGALNLGGYSGITAALGQASTGDDTSLAAIAQAGLEGAKHGAVTGSMFGATGAVMAPWIQKFGINGTETTKGQRWLHGAQKAGATALGLGVEAGTMMVADNVTGDKEISVGQWLEDVVMVGAFKAGEPSNYGKIGQALYGLTHNTNNTFRFGKDPDGNWRQVDIRLTDSEKNELMNSTSGKSLMDAFGKVDKSNLNSKDNIDKNITKLAYQEFMADPNVSQSTKEKVNAAMGLFNTTHKRSYRSVNDVQNKEVLEYAQDGTLLTRTSYKNADERRNILFRQKAYRDNEDLLSLVGYAKMKDSQYLDKDGKITDDAVAFLQAHGYDLSKDTTDSENAKIISNMQDENSELRYLWNENRSLTGVFASDSAKEAVEILKKDPMRRTDEEVQKLRQFKTELDAYCFPEGEAHPEQSQMQGRSIAEEEGLGSDTPNPAPVTTELRNLSAAEDALQELMDSNDVFKETYESMKKQGLANPQIYDAMIQQNGLTEEQLEPFARYLNANARVQGMQEATQEAIEQRVESMAGDWGFHGTMDGQQADGSQMLYVKDNNGRTLIVGSGDVAYDPTTGRSKEDVGDMLVCLDVQTREPVYVKVEDTTLDQIQNVEDFKNEERQRLQMINSAPYNQAAQEQAMKNAAKPQPKKEEVSQQQETIANDTQAEQPKPIGQSLFGNVYDAFRGKAKEAFNYLFTHKEGDLQGVYHRKDVGDIDLVWGDRTKNQGLDHIIDKHIEKNNDFDSLEEAAQVIDDVINNGEVNEKKSKWDKVVLEKDGYMVIISKNVRDKDGNVIDSNKNWVVTAFDSERGKGNKKRNPSDVTLVTPNTNEGSRAVAPDGSPFIGKDTNNSSNGNENNTSLTFEDGSPVPMVKDSKGRLTPDYGNMKPEQAAEILTKQFGESAEKVVGGQIKKAEKAVKDAEKMKVNYEGELNDILEQEELKRKTVSEAQKQLEHAQSIKKAMTVKKVAETVSKEEKPTEGANQAGSVASQKFQGAPRLVGNKRSRTLPNNEKIKGHYEIVPAESLTPSHDATNGYKKSDGFPVDAEGRTTNDRDYENDKADQQSTDQIALKYNGQAIEQVPVVSDEGIVYDGNGRTMAGQKAAKEGTDGEYISELLDNAENFGFTREQIEKSGIEHPRLVLVTDERMPYTTETFAKFNRNEKKAQNNTEQAVAKSKTLSPEDVGAIVSEIEGNGSLEAFFNNPNAISSLWKTLQEKGIIGQNEVAGLQDMPGVPNAQGKEFVKNLVLGAMFKPETIRMMGIDNAVKTKVVNGIRAIMDNSKLGDYALSDEVEGAIRLLYEARTNKMKVGDLLRSSDFVQGNARDRFSEISQALAQALEEKATVFRDLMSEYNNVVKNHNTGEGTLGFAETLDKEALVKEFLKTSETIKQNNIKLYGEEGRNSEQKDVDVPSGNEERPEEAGGRTGEEKPAESESQQRVDKAVKKLATEITKQTGVTVHTDEKESQKALEDAEATDSDVKYHKETDKEVLDELNSGKTVKVYRAMQVIDGKLYPPMAASVGGKLVEANELDTWIRADENPDLAIPDIDPKTGKQKVDPKTGELKWKFKLDKGGKDATGKKATAINAAYNPYWHMSRSPLNDQFKSAWIRPNIVVVECEVPESELTSGYKAERAKDAVGEVDWKSGSVSGEVFKQTGRARKVILSRWCKPVRVLDDAEVAQRAKEFVGNAKVEIPENVLTPKQRIAFEEAGFKIGAPEKGVKKSEQIAEALKAGLQVDNSVREFRSKNGEVYGFVVNGEIHLDTKKMKPETPLHEYTHLWTSALQRVNAKEWENVKSLLDSVEGLKDEVQKLYPDLKGDDLYDEMLAAYSGREGAKKLEETAKNIAANEGKSLTDSVKAKSFLGKVKEALKKYWNGVADMLHINFTSAEDVADKVLADWANGVNPNEVKAEEKSEPITITTEHGGEKTFSSEQVDMAKKIISENPEKPITHLQRQMKIGYEAANELAKALGWQEKPTFMPKEQKPTNPIEKAAEDYKKEHPLTDDEVSGTTVFDDLPEDQKQYCIDAALDYLHGEDTSAIAEAYYRNIYEKRGENVPQTDKIDTTSAEKDTTSTTPMEALKRAASEYSEPKTEPKKQTRKQLEAERDAADNEFDAFMKELRKKRMGQANSGFIDQNLIEAAPKMFSLAAKCAYSRIKLGMYDAKEVVKDLQKRFKEAFDGFDKKDVELFYSQIMSQKWRDGDKRMSLTDWAEYYRKLSPEHQEKLVGDSKTAEDRKQKENSFVSNLKMIMGSRKVNGIRELRQLAKELGLEGVKDTDLQELAETAVVSRARDIASSKAMSPERKFAEIRKLYENQPSLNQRDSDRVEKQQYSTPAPYAYLADMYVKGNGKEIGSALEPSAGNGMLTIGLPMDMVHVNDIDEARLMNLHRQGFKNITSQDGTQPFADKDVDVVVTNPPFGTATPKEYDGYKISSLEGQMAINALESMKDDGRAAIIIGGKTEYAKNGSLNPKDKAFLGYLYSHYNVEDVINVDGSLYAKQGTTYPTRIILIDGRRAYDPENKVYPPIQKEARAEAVKDYDELYKRINDDILRKQGVQEESVGLSNGERSVDNAHGGVGHTKQGSDGTPNNKEHGTRTESGVSDLGAVGRDAGYLGEAGRSSSRHLGDKTELEGEGRADPETDRGLSRAGSGLDNGGRVSEGSASGNSNETSNKGGTRGDRVDVGEYGRSSSSVRQPSSSREGNGLEVKKETPKRELNTEKVKYVSQSSNPFSLNSVVPADQAKVTKKALDKIGDVDEFLVSELGYNDKEDMYHALGSEQADSVALAIHQAKQGNAFIIGDMTGIGKGRQAAAMIRYAYKSGKIPVFITAKKDLFSDMYRDLKSIGNAELRPFIWAAKDKDNSADMLDSDGNLVYKRTSDTEQKKVMAYLKKYGKLPEEYDYIVTTYDSFTGGTMDYENGKKTARKDGKGSKNGQAKRDLLEVIAKNANVIMDESHKAGGNGGGSSYLQYIVPKLNAITFLSATYAKRPENMPIYALRTSMNQAGVEPAELIDAIKRGGTTLQEIMSQSLAASGQFIRRERDMTGVTIDWKAIEDPVVIQEQREQYDKIIGLFNDIIDFQRTYVNSYIDQRNEDISKTQGSIKNKQGTADLGIKNTPFASRTYNMVQQVLLSLKAREAAKSAVEHLKNGEKVVIALNNTNESQTGEYAEGVEMEAPDLGVVLKKGLNGVLRYEQSDDMDNKTYGYFDVEELGSEAAARYREIEDNINNASTGLSLSPIDVIRDELEDAGYKVGELTGRTYQLARNPNGTVSKVKRTNTDKKKLALDFNTDKLDVLILNRSASTGISLHDSKDFNVKEHKPRTMIVVQQQADVNEEVQMRGRIDRTGQVNRGRYEYIVSQIPSEQRLLMMFKSKLRSLDANTTSSQKSKFNDMEVNDIINKYGDKVVKEYMADHLDLYAKMADPFGWEKAFGADLSTIDTQKLIGTSDGKVGDKEAGADASKLLGRMALLKVAEQEKMLQEIGELYKNEINRLNEMGENDLEITELPLKAKTIGKEVWKEGSEPNGDNAFADNTYIEKVNMAILKKPMKAEEVKKAQEGLTGGRSWDEYKKEKKTVLKEYFVKKFNDEKVRLDERAKKIAQKAADKYNKEAKKNQEKNQLTDEQIEKNTQFQYDNVYKDEKAKADTALKNIKTKYQAFDRVLETFNTNEAYVLPTDMNNPNEMSAFGNSYGRLIDIKITDNYSPTASTISFATLDARRKITFPIHGLVGSGDKKVDVISTIYRLTKQAEAMDDNNYRVVNKSIDNWDRMISNESRKDGYIITGNLMQALIDTKAQGLGGQLVKYTTDNGEVKTGILMPDRFKPTDAATEKAISSKAEDFMSGKTTDIMSSDGDVRLISVSSWRGTTIELRVPKSKAKGGKYYLDEKLRSLADGNDFYTKGGSMVANVQPENVRGVLDRLSALGVKVREERKEGTHFRTEENSENGESSEKLFLSLQSDKSNYKKEHYDTVTELANRVKQGTARIVREGKETESDRPVNRRESIPAIAGRILNAANKQSDGQFGSLAGETSDKQREKVLRFNTLYGQIEDWAKKNGCYFTEKEIAKDSLDGKVWNDEGAESTVYRSKDGKSVIKVMSIDNYYNSPMDYYLDRNKYFNEAFPDTAIEVVGYGRDNDGRPAVIYKQPLIDGETVIEHFKGDEDAANSYIDKYLSDMGYNKKVAHDKWGGESDSNGKFNLFDVNYRNVIIDKDGKPHVIDAEVLPVDYKEGESIEIEDADSAKFRSDKPSVSITDDTSIVVKHVDGLSKKLGSNVNMVNSPEEVTNTAVKERLDKGENVTGWYDEKTGEVHLYMPNIHDRYTAEKTIWHEVVGHKGLRGLFGDKFNDFLRSIYYGLDKPENAELKKLVDEERKYNPLNIYDSIEEGIARLAEDGKGEVGFWNTIKNKVTDLLHEIGYRIAPNTKDVKYLIWLSKNLQKNPNSVYWKLKANAVRERLNREKPSVTDSEGMFFGDGKTRDLENMPKKEYQEATDGQIHFRTTPSAATAIDRYHRALNAHAYMFTESYMDNMLALKNLMQAIRPDNKKIEDIKSSENPYILQNTLQGAMSNEADMFERNIMKPLSKAMAGVLDAFEGAKDEDKIKNFNLYMIKKHGLERNRVFYVRDHINKLNRKEETKQDATNLQNDWNTLKKDLGDQLRRNAIRLDEYYNKMDEWIRNNIDQKFNPGDNDYSGFHGIYEIDKADAYDDAAVIAEVMDSEANMESVKRGSVADFWNKVNTATQYSLDSDYKNGLVTKDNHDNVSVMFDWYVPLRKFDETTAEEVYGYVTEKGDPSSFIGPALMKAKGRKSLSETNILAQIGAIGNLSISRGGKNAIKQAFARFVRNNGGQGLVTEVNTWVELDGYDANNKPIWKEALPQIPENATPDEVAKIVSDFESDMQAKKTKGEALNITNRGRIGFKFERAKDKSQHIVDVMIAGKKHSFVINGNPRAAQALNGLLENSKAKGVMKPLSTISRFMAQTCTSYSPEFVVRNIVRDAEFALANISAKEDTRYRRLFEKYYAGLIPVGGAKAMSVKDFSGSAGVGLFAKYRNGTLDTSNKIERYFKEFMENGGETGWVQIKSMKDWEKEYKQDVATERSDVRKNGKMLHDFFFGNLERLNEVAENQARFAVFCASRDYGRTAVRSAYDAKEVSVNFNRHGSGDAINSFKNGELGTAKNIEKKTIGFTSSYLRHCSMFFNAGIQSTNLLLKNIKTNPKKTIGIMASAPFALGALAALLNNCLIASEDEKDRKGVKDPYGELPDYIRRNNLCIYKGKGEFVTIPLAIELRAFYGIGDLAAGYTFAPNVKGQKEPVADAVGCLSQLVPVMDYLGNSSAGKDPGTEFIKAVSPSALSPLVEWGFNSDWKGSPIERRGDFYDNIPAWQRAYKGTPESLKSINKFVNAQSNDVAKGNEYMLGNKFLDAITNPSAINHFFGGFGGGATTFAERSLGLVSNKIKGNSVETKDIPFVRSFFYTPSEQSSMQRTKSKWYNYLDEMETTMENVKRLKSKNATPGEKLRNSADYYNFQNSDKSEKVNVIESAKRQMKRWRDLLKKSDDEESIKFANQNIDLIMQNAVDELDKLN